MKKHINLFVFFALFTAMLFTGCAKDVDQNTDTETAYQVSTLNALMLGYYDGIVTIGELLENGDTGLGTFHALDGEMILLDGVVYQAKADGSVQIQDEDTLVPFAAVTYFDEDIALTDLSDITDIEELKALLDREILAATENPNLFYFAKIEGDFSMVHVRSVPAQEKPYLPLQEITETQKEYIYENVGGTIIALRCPNYVEGINMPGWHLHFISDDGTMGGHLLDMSLITGDGQVDVTNGYSLYLPEDAAFGELDLVSDLEAATKAAEGK